MPSRPLPWRLVDGLVLWVSLIVGAAFLFLGWWGTSATARLSHQVAWLNVGAVGLMISGLGVVIWLAAGRRAVGRRRRVLLVDVGRRDAAFPPVLSTASEFVSTATMARYHHPDCAFATGKPVQAVSAIAHLQAGRRPCGLCLPEEGQS